MTEAPPPFLDFDCRRSTTTVVLALALTVVGVSGEWSKSTPMSIWPILRDHR